MAPTQCSFLLHACYAHAPQCKPQPYACCAPTVPSIAGCLLWVGSFPTRPLVPQFSALPIACPRRQECGQFRLCVTYSQMDEHSSRLLFYISRCTRLALRDASSHLAGHYSALRAHAFLTRSRTAPQKPCSLFPVGGSTGCSHSASKRARSLETTFGPTAFVSRSANMSCVGQYDSIITPC